MLKLESNVIGFIVDTKEEREFGSREDLQCPAWSLDERKEPIE
jgi:hypothetical protein